MVEDRPAFTPSGESAIQTEQLTQDDPSGARRRQLVACFLAATFGLMLVVSVPVARLLTGPLRPLIPLGGLFETFPRRHLQGAAVVRQAVGAGGSRAAIAPVAPGATNPAGGGFGPGPGGPQPNPRPGPTPVSPPGGGSGGGPHLRDSVSERDRRTVEVLQQAVDTFGVDRVLGALLRRTDMPTATRALVILAAQDRLEDIPVGITPAQVHAVLVEIRVSLGTALNGFDERAPGRHSAGRSESKLASRSKGHSASGHRSAVKHRSSKHGSKAKHGHHSHKESKHH